MIQTDHPNYPHPTILEALAEIYFVLPPSKPWRASFFGDFIKQIQSEFPEIEPILNMQFGAGIAPVARQRFRFKHAKRPLVLQLSETAFTVNVLSPYPGWSQMVQDIRNGWEQLTSAIEVEKVSRTSLRYINRIVLQSASQSAEHWLKPNDFIPPSVLRSNPYFFLRNETRVDEHSVFIVSVGYQERDETAPFGAILFDIDRILEQSFSAHNMEIIEEYHRLHDDIWQVFDSATTDALKRRLEGGD